MGVLRPKAGEHYSLLAGLPAAIRVLEMEQLGALGHINAAVARLDSGGKKQAADKNGRFIRLAHTFGVFEDEDLVIGFLPGFDLGVDRRTDDPKPATWIEVHLNRLGQQRAFGKEIDFKSGRNFKIW